MAIRILIVDDHQIIRKGIRKLLSDSPDVEVVGEASDGREAVREAEKMTPDVVLMDIGMPGLNGVEAIRKIARACRGVKIVVLSVYGDRDTIISAVEAGAAAFLLKDCSADQLNDAIRAASKGRSYLSPEISTIVLESIRQRSSGGPTKGDVGPLTPREREVLQLIAEGKTSRAIGQLLNVSPKTVQNHRNHIMRKLDLHNVADLTRYAISHGLTRLPG